MMRKEKLFGLLTIFLIGVLAISGIATAAITINEVELDDDSLGNGTNVIRDVERGDEFEVKVHAVSDENINDVQVEAYLRGYDHDDRAEDITDVFDMKANVTYVKKLTLSLPQRLDQDRYQLRVRVEGRDGSIAYNDYDLEIDTGRHTLQIKDVIFSPENEIKAGRALLTTVRVKNYGEKDEEEIKVMVSIPELETSASDYIDELEADESTTSEELYMRIPSCAEAGTYDVNVKIEFDDGDEVVSTKETITVVEDETCISAPTTTGAQPTIVYDATAQDITKGEAGAIYALTMTNPSGTSKTVTLAVNAVDDWGSYRVSPSNVIVIGAGETKTAYVYVSAKDAASAGQYGFSVTVSGLGTSSQQIPLTANIVEKAASLGGAKRALEIGFIVLVVIVVIIGLIIGFNKLKGSEEETEEEGKTYY